MVLPKLRSVLYPCEAVNYNPDTNEPYDRVTGKQRRLSRDADLRWIPRGFAIRVVPSRLARALLSRTILNS